MAPECGRSYVCHPVTQAPSDSPARPLLSLGKKLGFASAATLLFFGLLEGGLMLMGVRPLLYSEDPHVGFSSHVPLFVEGSANNRVTAQNKIRWFNDQRFAQDKSNGTTRVFCLGGSTTYGRPYTDATSFCGWLRQYLPAADPSREWEVINAGGISYASYRVAKLMEELIDYEPDVFVIYTGHNEFLEERTYSGIIETPDAVRGMQSLLGRTRTYSMVSGMLNSSNKTDPKTPTLTEEVNTILDQSAGLDRYTRDPQLESKIIAHYRYNLSRMVDIAESSGVQVIFITPAANLRNSSPFKSEHAKTLTESLKATFQSHMTSATKAVANEQHAKALSHVDQATNIDKLHAHGHFLRGEILTALERDEEAATAYEVAVIHDVCPLRMLPVMRDVLANTANARSVPLVDYHTFLAERSAHGVPGDDWFLDHVHPTIEGHRLLALKLIAAFETQGLLANKSALTDSSIDSIKNRVLGNIDNNAHGIALRNLGNVLNWAGKKREAYQAVTKSLELAPGDAYGHYLAGDLASSLGKTAEAEARFRELTKFELDPNVATYYPDAHYQLAQIVGPRGNTTESLRLLKKTLKLQADHAKAREAFPRVLEAHGKNSLKAGQPSEAVAAFQQLEKWNPNHSMATILLGVARIEEKKFPEAVDVLHRAIKKNPQNPIAHNNLGSAYARSNQPTEAERHFKSAIQVAPNHVGAQLNLARLLETSNRNNEAAQHYATALKLQPTSAEAKAGLARTRDSK